MTTATVLKKTGLTPRLLNQMHESGHICEDHLKYRKKYSDEDMELLRIVSELRSMGISTQMAKRLVPKIKRQLAEWAPAFVVGLDEDVRFCASAEDAVKLQIKLLKEWAGRPNHGSLAPRVYIVATEQK